MLSLWIQRAGIEAENRDRILDAMRTGSEGREEKEKEKMSVVRSASWSSALRGTDSCSFTGTLHQRDRAKRRQQRMHARVSSSCVDSEDSICKNACRAKNHRASALPLIEPGPDFCVLDESHVRLNAENPKRADRFLPLPRYSRLFPIHPSNYEIMESCAKTLSLREGRSGMQRAAQPVREIQRRFRIAAATAAIAD